MATCSGIFAWEIPQTEEPGGRQSTGSQESDTTEQTAPPSSRSNKILSPVDPPC